MPVPGGVNLEALSDLLSGWRRPSDASLPNSQMPMFVTPPETSREEKGDTMWEGVGQFVGDAPGIPDTEFSMEDIQNVAALPDSRL